MPSNVLLPEPKYARPYNVQWSSLSGDARDTFEAKDGLKLAVQGPTIANQIYMATADRERNVGMVEREHLRSASALRRTAPTVVSERHHVPSARASLRLIPCFHRNEIMARSKGPSRPAQRTGKNQGEGDKESARRFNDAERAFVASEVGRDAIRTGSKPRNSAEDEALRDAEAEAAIRARENDPEEKRNHRKPAR